jgi:hypothetical protein
MADAKGDGGFLARWSGRKQAARRGPTPPAEPAPQAADGPGEVAEAGPGAGSDLGPEQVLTDADMPPLASLDGFSDYSAFLSPGVSAALRGRALAQLFHSPHLNVTDGLSEFAGDYTHFEPLGDLVTADMRHGLEVAARRLAEGAQAAGEVSGAAGPAHRTAAVSSEPGPEPKAERQPTLTSAPQDRAPADLPPPEAPPQGQAAPETPGDTT